MKKKFTSFVLSIGAVFSSCLVCVGCNKQVVRKTSAGDNLTAFAVGVPSKLKHTNQNNKKTFSKNTKSYGQSSFQKVQLWAEVNGENMEPIDFGLGKDADNYYLVSYVESGSFCFVCLSEEKNVGGHTNNYSVPTSLLYSPTEGFTSDRYYIIDKKTRNVFDISDALTYNLKAWLDMMGEYRNFIVVDDAVYFTSCTNEDITPTLKDLRDWEKYDRDIYIAKMTVKDGELVKDVFYKNSPYQTSIIYVDKNGSYIVYHEKHVGREGDDGRYYNFPFATFVNPNTKSEIVCGGEGSSWTSTSFAPMFYYGFDNEMYVRDPGQEYLLDSLQVSYNPNGIKVDENGEEYEIFDYCVGMSMFSNSGIITLTEALNMAKLYEDDECIYIDYSLLNSEDEYHMQAFADMPDFITIEKYYKNWAKKPVLKTIEYDNLGGKFKDFIVYEKEGNLYSYNFVKDETEFLASLASLNILDFTITFSHDGKIYIDFITNTLQQGSGIIENGTINYDFAEQDFYITTLYPIN